MRKEFQKFNYVIEIEYPKGNASEQKFHKLSNKFSRITRYLELEFGVIPLKISENRRALTILVDEDFDQDAVTDYLLQFVEPDNLSIYNNK